MAERLASPWVLCSRAFIRAVMEDPDYPVPSPTFTLQNIYDEHEGAVQFSLLPCPHGRIASAEPAGGAGPEVHHFDLYRLDGPQGRLDMAASFAKAVSLIEWPERMPPSSLPEVNLLVAIHRPSEVGLLCCCHRLGCSGCGVARDRRGL